MSEFGGRQPAQRAEWASTASGPAGERPAVLLLSTADTELLAARASGALYRTANPARLELAGLPALLTGVAGVAATALSSAMAYGPVHAWAWLTLPTQAGMVAAALFAVCLLPIGRRWCAVLLLLVLMWQLNWLNQAPLNPYFAETLQSWEQGRFMRFYGLGQWLGWLWPYAVLAYVALRLSQRQGDS